METINSALQNVGVDPRPFEQGEVYLTKDLDVKIPDDKLTGRTYHNKRPVVIVYNHPTNKNPLFPSVVAAPLSHELSQKRDTDLEVTKKSNGVERDSLLRLGLIQPFLKIDLQGPVTRLSDHCIDQMLALLLHLIGVDMEDTETAVDLFFEK